MSNLGARTVESAAKHGQWRARPWAATGVRTATTVLPILAALAAGAVVTTWWAQPDSGAAQLAWWLSSVAAACIASYATARVARRLLPLATLLKLSLTFPDRTPSRFGLALRAGTLSDVKSSGERLASAQLPLAEAVAEALVLATALTRHDRATRGHSERVRAMTEVLAEELGLSAHDRDQLRWAGLLHDVGKVTVPSAILNKPGPLTEQEWVVMRLHPAESGRMVEPLRPWLGRWTDAVGQHHERFDGSGYPHGLVGDRINLGARIVAVADTFDVMTATRSYKRALPAAAAREEISTHAGDLFDPSVARALLNVSLGRLRWTTGPLVWIAASPFVAKVRAAAASVGGSASSSIAGVAGGVLAAALAVGPTAPAVTPHADRPAVRLITPSAALPMPESAATGESPPAAAGPPAEPPAAEPLAAPAEAVGLPASPSAPRTAATPIARPPAAVTPVTGPTPAATKPLVAIEVDLAPIPARATAAVRVGASPVQASVEIGPLPPLTIGAKR